MKILLIIIPILVFTCELKAQTLKKVKNKSYSNLPFNESGVLKIVEVFYVLKKNQQVKHGDYERFILENQIFEKGQYHNGEKTAVWEYYNFAGDLTMKFNHSSNRIEFVNDVKYSNFKFDNIEYLNEASDLYPLKTVDFIGGKDRFIFYLMYESGLDYPYYALVQGIKGTVYVSFVITPDGEIIQEKIEKNVDDKIDGGSLAAIKNIPNEFVPYPENELLKQSVRCYQTIKFN